MPNAASRPLAKTDGRDLGDEYLFYDRERDRVHVLNETAREIFLLCDGSRTQDEVASAFAEKQEIDKTIAKADAVAVLRNLSELGLIVYN